MPVKPPKPPIPPKLKPPQEITRPPGGVLQVFCAKSYSPAYCKKVVIDPKKPSVVIACGAKPLTGNLPRISLHKGECVMVEAVTTPGMPAAPLFKRVILNPGEALIVRLTVVTPPPKPPVPPPPKPPAAPPKKPPTTPVPPPVPSWHRELALASVAAAIAGLVILSSL